MKCILNEWMNKFFFSFPFIEDWVKIFLRAFYLSGVTSPLRIIQMIIYPEYYLTPFPLGLSHSYFLDIGEQLWKYSVYVWFKPSATGFLYQLSLSHISSYWMMPIDAAENMSLNNSISMGTAARALWLSQELNFSEKLFQLLAGNIVMGT